VTGMSAEERTLAAEVRAVERGSHARLAGDGTTMLVASESEPGVNRHVRVQAVGMVVTFTCSCPYGNNQPKTIPCVQRAVWNARAFFAGRAEDGCRATRRRSPSYLTSPRTHSWVCRRD
jgi:hypothetical protein